MSGYSPQLARQYSQLRDTFTATDTIVFELLEKMGVKNKDILDFGCGDGRYSFLLKEMGAKSVTGIDSSEEMINLAKARANNEDNTRFFAVDGNALPFEDFSFDLVFANFVLHHFVNTLKPIRQIYRVLRDNACFIGTFNSATLKDPELFNTEIPLRLGKKDFVTVHNLLKSDDAILRDFKEGGLTIISYKEEVNPYLSIDAAYPRISEIQEIKTVVCIAQKVGSKL